MCLSIVSFRVLIVMLINRMKQRDAYGIRLCAAVDLTRCSSSPPQIIDDEDDSPFVSHSAKKR